VRLLLDTHAVVWWWLDDPRLPAKARAAIAAADNVVCVSAASAWEVATKIRLGKWPDVARIADEFPDLLRRSRFAPLSVSVEHGMLIAQSRQESAVMISADPVFRQFGVDVILD
jgi:PIN domain nuclease of toxin-antitoxin system